MDDMADLNDDIADINEAGGLDHHEYHASMCTFYSMHVKQMLKM